MTSEGVIIDYFERARDKGLDFKKAITFAKFMAIYSPNEKNVGYINEWINRFKFDPVSWMDTETQRMYERALIRVGDFLHE